MPELVAFEGAHGTVLRGRLFLPDGADAAGPVPGVVMAHGFSATRGMGLDDYADVLCAAGFAVLAYDHRNLGESDGEPRGEINIFAQARDYRYALDHLAARPEVDADRLAVWGTSYSGGQVLLVGAVDTRVRAVVANVPFAGLPGEPLTEQEAGERFAVMAAAIDQGTAAARGGPADAAGPVAGPIAVVDAAGDGAPAFLASPDAARWFLAAGTGRGWVNSVTLVPAGGPPFDPGVCPERLGDTALLVVAATEDTVAPTVHAVAAYEKASGPRRLELVEGGHFDDYTGPGFAQASAAMVDFLKETLK